MSKIQEIIQKESGREYPRKTDALLALLAALDVLADEIAGIRGEIAKANESAEKFNALYKLD